MHKLFYLLLFSCLVLFQSCFEIIEQVFLKNDGSGNFQLLVNLSKSKTKLNSMISMKSINGHKVPSKAEISARVNEIKTSVANTAGLSNVETTLDLDNFIASVSCNFNNVQSLNNAVVKLGTKDGRKTAGLETIYSFDAAANIFSRWNKFSFKELYNKMSNADKEVFAASEYTAIYKFESTVEHNTNPSAKISANKKAVMLRLNILDVVTGKISPANSIQLRK